MPIKKVTLGLALLLVSSAVAQTKHKIRPNETISKLATIYHVPTSAILRANGLTASSRLKLGQEIFIPKAEPKREKSSRKTASATASGKTYKVRNGDSDWTIARKFDLHTEELHAANPGVSFHPLKLGINLRIPSSDRSTVVAQKGSSTKPNPKTTIAKTTFVAKKAKKAKFTTYRVESGDNDWAIAGKLGISRKLLVSLNPKVKWRNIRPGAFLVIPGTSGDAPSSSSSSETRVASQKIRSRFAKVIGDSSTIRRGPSTGSDIVTRVDRGLRVVVLDREGDWYKLRFPRGTVGWMRGDLLQPTSAPSELLQERRSQRTRIARRRRGGSTLSSGERSRILAQVPSKDSLLAKARTYVGVRYRLGMASRSGTDCSGFTTQVFRSEGVRLPRTSREQASVGRKVGKAGLSAGDLVFFRTGRGSRISHVGIYVGNGKFIHASSGGGRVQVNSLSDGYYSKRFVTARRVKSKPVASKKAVNSKKTVQKAPARNPVTQPVAQPTTTAPTQSTAPTEQTGG